MKMLLFVCLRERIIEYRLGCTSSGPLVGLPTESFVRAVGARTSAPGGGSVAALLAALVSYIWKSSVDV
jgi:glutamate formiminotransferase/formiminotetrahydrofolate cyclodeaminase